MLVSGITVTPASIAAVVAAVPNLTISEAPLDASCLAYIEN